MNSISKSLIARVTPQLPPPTSLNLANKLQTYETSNTQEEFVTIADHVIGSQPVDQIITLSQLAPSGSTSGGPSTTTKQMTM